MRSANEKAWQVALAGNPNVGKSTVFNALTGLKQHTGNWPGKTVAQAVGKYTYDGDEYTLVDLPGTYSIKPHSVEEEVARDCLVFEKMDAVVVVCDATCIERNLNLVLQITEITSNVVVCINLLDEAAKKGIDIDLDILSSELGVEVIGTSARSGKGLQALQKAIQSICQSPKNRPTATVQYIAAIENAVEHILPSIPTAAEIDSRWLALRLLERDETLVKHILEECPHWISTDSLTAADEAIADLAGQGIGEERIRDIVISAIILTAEGIALSLGLHTCKKHSEDCAGSLLKNRDRRLDKIFTSKATGIPIMILLLCGVFWLTIVGSNYPSELLASGLFWVQDRLTDVFVAVGAPDWVHGLLVEGVYRVLAWVVSVMLPPMAIFFPLFTLLEDFGYLPRVAFNLDHYFRKAKTCGKQALTMCMGFGCNAVGVTGCRIIDSPRERLIAIITNSFVPCNGRFPTLIAIITMFFVGSLTGLFQTALSALLLTGLIVLGVALTFWVSRLLSSTILKGEASSFALELPPYRTPQIGKVLVRSMLDRTLFVLRRAVAVAAPAGAVIWLLANVTVGEATLLSHCAMFLDPIARCFGLDGVILLAFILGFPANEIVVPIMIMAYLSTGTLTEMGSLTELRQLLISNGWTASTAISTMLLCLVHWPCSTTMLTIKKETKSIKWTALSMLIPTAIGLLICFLFNLVASYSAHIF